MVCQVDLRCEQGADLCFSVDYRRGATDIPVDLTGGCARMQVRASRKAPVPFLDIDSSEKGGITMEGATGRFHVFVSSDATAKFEPTHEARYDLEFRDANGHTSRVLEGRFRVTGQVTQYVDRK